jgi:hypothetical protein
MVDVEDEGQNWELYLIDMLDKGFEKRVREVVFGKFVHEYLFDELSNKTIDLLIDKLQQGKLTPVLIGLAFVLERHVRAFEVGLQQAEDQKPSQIYFLTTDETILQTVRRCFFSLFDWLLFLVVFILLAGGRRLAFH